MQEQKTICSRCKEKIQISGNTLSKRGTRKYLTCPKCGYKMNDMEIEISQIGTVTSWESQRRNTKHIPDPKFSTEKQNLKASESRAPTSDDKSQQHKQTLMSAFKFIVTFPRYLGFFVLDVFGRNEAKESSALITGWLIVIILLLIWKGVVTIQSIEAIWRFFFPVK